MNPVDPRIILAAILAARSSLLGPLNGTPTFHVTDDGLYAYDAPAGSYGLVDVDRIPIDDGDVILDTSLDRADGYVERGDDGAYVGVGCSNR